MQTQTGLDSHVGRERQTRTIRGDGYPGSRLNQSIAREGTVGNASIEPVPGKTRRTEFKGAMET
jgi:hypothetical protein